MSENTLILVGGAAALLTMMMFSGKKTKLAKKREWKEMSDELYDKFIARGVEPETAREITYANIVYNDWDVQYYGTVLQNVEAFLAIDRDSFSEMYEWQNLQQNEGAVSGLFNLVHISELQGQTEQLFRPTLGA